LKLLLVRNVDVTGEVGKGYVVAADSVGAGLGEVVLYATGSSARQTDITNGKPVDAVVMGIVDTWDVDDKTVYTKYASAKTADV
ncbi:MAG: EutN/CcmL family microcompartment protein, partial [Nitrospinae bacterium]|nr:EutN/CcmL family microcompartment protein [Nitrospinota bacterium]